jgi:homoserine dehydrogenase
VSDLVDVVRSLTVDPENRVPHLAFQPDAIHQKSKFLAIEEIETGFYLRMKANDQTGVLAKIATILSEAGISIDAVSQKPPMVENAKQNTIAILTHRVQEQQMNLAIKRIENLPEIIGKLTRIRVENLI